MTKNIYVIFSQGSAFSERDENRGSGGVAVAASAYVLLNVEQDMTAEVVRRLRSVPGVIVREVLDPYEMVGELEGDTAVNLTWTVRNKIRATKGVSASVTCMWMEGAFAGDSGGE
jgi:hypothetical protein